MHPIQWIAVTRLFHSSRVELNDDIKSADSILFSRAHQMEKSEKEKSTVEALGSAFTTHIVKGEYTRGYELYERIRKKYEHVAFYLFTDITKELRLYGEKTRKLDASQIIKPLVVNFFCENELNEELLHFGFELLHPGCNCVGALENLFTKALRSVIRSCFTERKFDKCLEICDIALNIGHDQKNFIYQKAKALHGLGLGREDDFEEVVSGAVRDGYNSSDLQELLGSYHKSRGDYPEAIAAYINAVQLLDKSSSSPYIIKLEEKIEEIHGLMSPTREKTSEDKGKAFNISEEENMTLSTFSGTKVGDGSATDQNLGESSSPCKEEPTESFSATDDSPMVDEALGVSSYEDDQSTAIDQIPGSTFVVTAKLNASVSFSIKKSAQGNPSRFYQGKMHCGCERDGSFILLPQRCDAEHLFNFLRSMNGTHKSILRVEFLIDADPEDFRKMLVVEQVDALDDFFMRKKMAFGTEELSKPGCKHAWWKFIESSFRQIFCDVVQGMMFLFKRGIAYKNLSNGIFVTPNGRGKILLSTSTTNEVAGNINQLRKKMENIIGFPFGLKEVASDEDFMFDLELKQYFTMLETEKLKHVDPCWLIDSPFFWGPLEKLKFFFKLRDLCKEDVILDTKFNLFLETIVDESISLQERRGKYGGAHFRTALSEGSVLYRIYEKGDPGNSERKTLYMKEADFVRYICAVYTHHNDREYRPTKSKIAWERQLRKIFPRMYVCFRKAILAYSISAWNIEKKAKGLQILLSTTDIVIECPNG